MYQCLTLGEMAGSRELLLKIALNSTIYLKAVYSDPYTILPESQYMSQIQLLKVELNYRANIKLKTV